VADAEVAAAGVEAMVAVADAEVAAIAAEIVATEVIAGKQASQF
jgi:hypothetical protein